MVCHSFSQPLPHFDTLSHEHRSWCRVFPASNYNCIYTSLLSARKVRWFLSSCDSSGNNVQRSESRAAASTYTLHHWYIQMFLLSIIIIIAESVTVYAGTVKRNVTVWKFKSWDTQALQLYIVITFYWLKDGWSVSIHIMNLFNFQTKYEIFGTYVFN